MGTDYYARVDPCNQCGRIENEVHLCKISAGWLPLIRLHGEQHYSDWDSFKSFIKRDDIIVVDETGLEVDPDTLIQRMTSRYEEPDDYCSHKDQDDVIVDGGSLPIQFCKVEFL